MAATPARPRLPRRSAAASPLLSAVALAVAACGGVVAPSASLTASPSAAPHAFSASGFTTVVPHLWTDRTSDQQVVDTVNAGGTVQMLLIAPPTAAGLSNEHIDVSTPAQPVPDDQLASYLQSVGQNGATNISQPEPFDLDGATGIFITYDLTSSDGVPLMSQDMLVNHGGVSYEIVLNTARSDFTQQQPALQQILTAWRWSS